jgi:hypothetical protein
MYTIHLGKPFLLHICPLNMNVWHKELQAYHIQRLAIHDYEYCVNEFAALPVRYSELLATKSFCKHSIADHATKNGIKKTMHTGVLVVRALLQTSPVGNPCYRVLRSTYALSRCGAQAPRSGRKIKWNRHRVELTLASHHMDLNTVAEL